MKGVFKMISCGFFGSYNHDRRYDTRQISSMFDGIIRDGIYMSIGDHFAVTASDSLPNDENNGMPVIIGTGRAWFDHSWTLNDAPVPIYIPQSEVILNRIDAVVLDVNSALDVRNNDVIVIKGTPGTNPQKPNLIKSVERNQYPLAYIYVAKGATTITQANITNAVGTSETPFVTGILETINIDSLISQWSAQWNEYVIAYGEQADQFYNESVADIQDFQQKYKADLNAWKMETQANIMDWFNNLQQILSDDAQVQIATDLMSVKDDIQYLREHAIIDSISDKPEETENEGE